MWKKLCGTRGIAPQMWKLVRGAALAADRHSWRDRERRLSWRASNIIEWPTSLGFRHDFLKSIQRYYRKISNDAAKTGPKFVGAQKTEISISADVDFAEMKKTETPSKSRRVGRYVKVLVNWWSLMHTSPGHIKNENILVLLPLWLC